MKLLDTPQWNALTSPQKNLVNNITSSGDPEYVCRLSGGARQVADALEAKGLITVRRDTPGHGQVTLALRPEGWES